MDEKKKSFMIGYLLGQENSDVTPEPEPEIEDPDYQLFLDMPDPADNQTVHLLRVIDNSNRVDVWFYCGFPDSADITHTYVSINWGDGTIDDINIFDEEKTSAYFNHQYHSYESTGDYIITITKIDNWCLYWAFSATYHKEHRHIAAKYGEKIRVESYSAQGIGALKYQYLKYIKIPADTIFDGGNFFSFCYALQKIIYDGKPSKIPSRTFYDCCNLKNLDEWDLTQVESVEVEAFGGCCNLKSVSFPQCTVIAEEAFNACYGLKKISFPQCATIKDYAFRSCCSLNKVEMPLCTTIGDYAFRGCCSLITTVFHEDCAFSDNSFYDCYSLY